MGEHHLYKSNDQWRDFDYKHLINGWGHILELEGAKGKLETEISDSQREIIDEDKIDSISEAWNIECLRDPLKRGGAHLRGTDKPDITIKKKYMQYTRPGRKPLEPDMTIFLRDGDRQGSTTLVVGDNKCETKWDHEKMMDTAKSTEFLWPVRQIITYAVAGATRYAWIMTTKEVVVFRVSTNPSTSGSSQYLVDWKAVPWSNSGEGTLTVNLAMWWLGMLSLAEKHRAIVMPSQMYSINTWQKTQDDEGEDVYTHLLSRRTVEALADGEVQI